MSNSDNLGATLDLDLLHYFATSNKAFLMEVSGGGARRMAGRGGERGGEIVGLQRAASKACWSVGVASDSVQCLHTRSPPPLRCTAVPGYNFISSWMQPRWPGPLQVCERTAADKKGGHLCVRKADGRLMLRESAMCPDADKKAFEDIAKHK